MIFLFFETPNVNGTVKSVHSGFGTCFAHSTWRWWDAKRVSNHEAWRHHKEGGARPSILTRCSATETHSSQPHTAPAACAVLRTHAALQVLGNIWVVLAAPLKLLVGVRARVFVAKADHNPDQDLVGGHVVKERASSRLQE